MKYVNYTDSDSYSLSKDYEEIVERALNSAIANLLVDGIIITEEQKEKDEHRRCSNVLCSQRSCANYQQRGFQQSSGKTG